MRIRSFPVMLASGILVILAWCFSIFPESGTVRILCGVLGVFLTVGGGFLCFLCGKKQASLAWQRDDDQLRRLVRIWRSAIHALPAHVFVKDADHDFHYVFANEAVQRFFGRTREQLRHLNDQDLFPEEIAREFRKADEARVQGLEHGQDNLIIVPDCDGNIHRMRTVQCPFVDEDGSRFLFGISVDVTTLEEDRLQARELNDRLQDLLLQHNMLLDNIPAYVYAEDIDNDFRHVSCNRICTELFGRPLDDILGRNDYELFGNREEVDAFRKMDEDAAKSEEITEYVLPFTGVDGTSRLGHFYRRRLNLSGNRHWLFGFVFDITEQERTKNERRELLERYSILLDNMPVSVTTRDIGDDYRYTSCNAFFAKLMGRTPEEIVGKTDREISWSTADAESIDAENRRVVAELENQHELLSSGTFTDVDGRLRRGRFYRKIVTSASGRRQLFVMATDVTDLEEARHRAEENAEWFRLTLDSIGDGVLTTDAHGNVVMLNPVAERMLGCRREDVIGLPHENLFRNASYGSDEPISSPLVRALRTGCTVELANHTVLISRDERRYHISDSAAPIRDATGGILGAILVFRDVTEEYLQRDRLRTLLAQLQAGAEMTRSAMFRVNRVTREISGSRLLHDLWPMTSEGKIPAAVEWIHPEDIPAISERLGELERGETERATVNFRTSYFGEMRHCRWTMVPDRTHPRPGEQFLGVIQDVTDFNNLARNDRVVNEALQRISLENDFGASLEHIAGTLREQFGPDHILLARVNEDGDLYCFREWPSGADHVTSRDLACYAMVWNQHSGQIRDQQVIRYDDFSPQHPDLKPVFGQWEDCPVKSLMGVPVFVEDELWGVLFMSFTKKRSFGDSDGKLMTAVVNIASLAIIRERQNQTIQLADRERQMILDNIRIPLWLYDAEGQVVQVNRSTCELTGCSQDELRIRSCHDIFDCSLAEHGGCPVQLSMKDHQPHQASCRLHGREYILDVRPIPDEQGKLRNLVETAVDITDLNSVIRDQQVVSHCLELIVRHDDRSQYLQDVLRSICEHMEASRCYIISFDRQTMTGHGVAEYGVSGKPDLVFGLPDVPYRTDEPWYQACLRHEQVEIPGQNSEKYIFPGGWEDRFRKNCVKSVLISGIHTNDGLWGELGVVYEDTSPPAFTEQNRTFLRSAAHIIELMVERERSRQQLVSALQQAQAAARAKNFFIASVSHEIRTPLNAVIGFAELLKDCDVSPETRREYLESIRYAGRSLLQLIGDVLDLSRLEADQLRLRPEPTDFRELGQDCLRIFTSRAAENQLELRAEIADIPCLELDQPRIRQILFNLIGNAVKFTPHGTVTLTASFAREDERTGTLTIAVADTGIGISQEDQKGLMQPFVQLNRMRPNDFGCSGTGLGLAISRQLVERMGGKIFLRSAVGKGSTFYVELPHILISTKEKMTWTMDASRPAPDVLPTPSVLVVDDVGMNLRVLEAGCRRAGARHVVSAASGREALDALARESFDLVLTDMWMPGMSGAELAERIHNDPRCSDIPVVAVTADVEVRDNFTMARFHGILLKPVTQEKLKQVFANLVPGKSDEREKMN
ncbi:MAG: PAS domain-containing protein, partial [Planctomycetia bacterium]|nr:PAS domain-containing protein [Planctomycetia bacterium]